jgi:hypothetical protein
MNAPVVPPGPPTTVSEAFQHSHPLHRAFAKVWEELGGGDFLRDWAEDHPTEFVNVMLRLTPAPNTPLGAKENSMHLHVHPGLQAGPLDGGDKVVATQDGEDS